MFFNSTKKRKKHAMDTLERSIHYLTYGLTQGPLFNDPFESESERAKAAAVVVVSPEGGAVQFGALIAACDEQGLPAEKMIEVAREYFSDFVLDVVLDSDHERHSEFVQMGQSFASAVAVQDQSQKIGPEVVATLGVLVNRLFMAKGFIDYE